jgi:heme oxygenase
MQGEATSDPARKDILARLKLETAAEHAAVEQAVGIMHPELSLPEYQEYLEKTFGFYLPVEQSLRAMGVWRALDLAEEERTKLGCLARDLRLLGQEDLGRLAVCGVPPVLSGIAEAVGCAYVLEGSTLGGRLISRHVQHRFGPAIPRSFLECYASQTGERWQAFRAAVLRFATTGERESRVLSGAQETFRSFTRWLTRPGPS